MIRIVKLIVSLLLIVCLIGGAIFLYTNTEGFSNFKGIGDKITSLYTIAPYCQLSDVKYTKDNTIGAVQSGALTIRYANFEEKPDVKIYVNELIQTKDFTFIKDEIDEVSFFALTDFTEEFCVSVSDEEITLIVPSSMLDAIAHNVGSSVELSDMVDKEYDYFYIYCKSGSFELKLYFRFTEIGESYSLNNKLEFDENQNLPLYVDVRVSKPTEIVNFIGAKYKITVNEFETDVLLDGYVYRGVKFTKTTTIDNFENSGYKKTTFSSNVFFRNSITIAIYESVGMLPLWEISSELLFCRFAFLDNEFLVEVL